MFEHARQTFDEHLKAAGETIDGWRESARAHTSAAGVAFRDLIATGPPHVLRDSIVAAEHRCEEALADLKHARTALQSALTEGTGFLSRRHLRRSFREARRSAHEAIEHWQELGSAYLERTAVTIPSAHPA
jgi:hypothetical protein